MVSSALVSRFLRACFEEVVSDKAHEEVFLNGFGGFGAEMLHLERGFDVAKAQLDIPSLVVKGGEFDPVVGFVFEEGGGENEPFLFSAPIFIVVADEADGHGLGEGGPLVIGHGAAGGLLCRLGPGDETLMFVDFLAFAPVEFEMALLMEAHEASDSALLHGSNEFVGAEGAVSAEEVAFLEAVK